MAQEYAIDTEKIPGLTIDLLKAVLARLMSMEQFIAREYSGGDEKKMKDFFIDSQNRIEKNHEFLNETFFADYGKINPDELEP